MLHGAGAFRQALTEKLALVRRFHEALQQLVTAGAPLEIVAAPQLTVVAFRLQRRPGEALTAWNARSAALLRAINARQRVYLSSTSLPISDGRAFTLRVCVLNFRTHAQHVDACVEDLEWALAEIGAG
jgi:aromatic-L-amino-acid decarboxylase